MLASCIPESFESSPGKNEDAHLQQCTPQTMPQTAVEPMKVDIEWIGEFYRTTWDAQVYGKVSVNGTLLSVGRFFEIHDVSLSMPSCGCLNHSYLLAQREMYC